MAPVKAISEGAAKHFEKYFVSLANYESYTFINLVVDKLESPVSERKKIIIAYIALPKISHFY